MSVLATDRSTAASGGVLLAAAAASWVALPQVGDPMGLPGFLGAWTLMMAAMMLPSILPLVLLYRRSRLSLAAAYLLTWAATGLVPYGLMEADVMPMPALVLGLAAVYELSPLKTACLRRCRNVAGFLMERYRSSAFRVGVDHALWCIGCCVGLMVVLVLAASMSLAWAAVIAAVVFVQKALPLDGELSARLTGAGLLVAAAVTLIV